MKEKLSIQSVMTIFPHSIGVEQSLAIAKQMMQEHNIRHLPVQKAGELVGVISHRDIHFALAVDKKDASEVKVNDAFTHEPYCVTLTTPVDHVARRMAQEGHGCALVLENEKLVGIFTTIDACRALAEVLTGSINA